MVEFFEDFHLLEGVEEINAFAGVEDLADSIYPAIALEDLAHNTSASPDHLGKMVQLMGIAPLPIDDLLCTDLDILLSAETVNSVDRCASLQVGRFAAHNIIRI